MNKKDEQDIYLKLRFRAILYSQGFWSPLNVELSYFEDYKESLKRKPITDLDVLGIKYDTLFTPTLIVGDCKSGAKDSGVNRLFWLKGVSEFFNADQAYFIHPNIKSHIRGIAPKIGLRVLDEDALVQLEKNLKIEKLFLPLQDIKLYEQLSNLWGIKVPKDSKPTQNQIRLKHVYSYLSYNYWYIEQYRNLFNIIDNFKNIALILNAENLNDIRLAYVGLERFAHSILEIIRFIFSQGATNIPRDTKYYLFGGTISLKEKEEFIKLLNSLTKANEKLEPSFLNDIIELIGRIVRNPVGAVEILIYLEAIYIWCVHLGNENLPALRNDKQNTEAIVLSRDIAITFLKITGLKENLFKAVLSL